ncbi:UDP-N-acetyl glucosamine 2-epimerase [Planctomycetaceae bacterium SCGC AG-212-F19]|nr:UDP-N-acetyl glucosamine 2-epimerase [Planctomycetaceae bacterium SCGC AG-212-F19]
MRILTIFGTRPEALKLAPLIQALRALDDVELRTCSTGQHRQMLDQVLQLFAIAPDYELGLMRPGQNLGDVTAGVCQKLGPILEGWRPDWIVVQGDTTTAFAAALVGFYHRISVAHVEAGLRTGNPWAPWPEEMNRRLISAIAELHFAPTRRAMQNLFRESTDPTRVRVTGNTIIDALIDVVGRLRSDATLTAELAQSFPFLDPAKRLILVTAHRRESFGEGMEHICQALAELSARGDVQVVYPVHLNPQVQEPVKRLLADCPNFFAVEPLDYLPFVFLMDRSYLIITDSGGVQEEAPSLGKPVLVLRETTERPEAVEAGTVILVGTDPERIVGEAQRLLDRPAEYTRMTRVHNPYGDGRAAQRIARELVAWKQLADGRRSAA